VIGRRRSLKAVAPDDEALDLDLLAASLRADASDLGAFVESLARKLEEAVPGRVRVERRRDGMFGPKRVRRIVIEAADQRLELEASDGVLQTNCSSMSGGIVLKRQQVTTDAWLAALGETLAVEARRSDTTRQALERLLTQ
jgi:hypothetical protein